MSELRRRRAGVGPDSGWSLIELLVVMVLFSGIVLATYSVLASIQSQTAAAMLQADDTNRVRLGLQQIDRQLRAGDLSYNPAGETTTGCTSATVAPSLVPNAGSCVRLYSERDGVPRCFQWQVLSGKLRSRSWWVTWQTDGIVTAWQTTAIHIVNPVASPPFVLKGMTTTYASRELDVQIYVQSPNARGAPNQLHSSLSGRNTKYGYVPGYCAQVPA